MAQGSLFGPGNARIDLCGHHLWKALGNLPPGWFYVTLLPDKIEGETVSQLAENHVYKTYVDGEEDSGKITDHPFTPRVFMPGVCKICTKQMGDHSF